MGYFKGNYPVPNILFPFIERRPLLHTQVEPVVHPSQSAASAND